MNHHKVGLAAEAWGNPATNHNPNRERPLGKKVRTGILVKKQKKKEAIKKTEQYVKRWEWRKAHRIFLAFNLTEGFQGLDKMARVLSSVLHCNAY